MQADDLPTRTGGRTALVYGDIDVRLIDGSSVWLVTMSELLALAGCKVTLLLKGEVDADVPLLEPIRATAAVHLVAMPQPRHAVRVSSGFRMAQAMGEMHRLDSIHNFDMLVVRGMSVAARMAREEQFKGRLWPYLTDFPQSVLDLDHRSREDLQAIAQAACVALCQTEEIRSYLESVVPEFVGRTAILPPAVPSPDAHRVSEDDGADGRPVRLVYSGKFAPLWNTLEMTDLPRRLEKRGLPAELIVVGDKVNDDPEDRTYRTRMRSALAETPGVRWHRGRSREEAMQIVAAGDIGLSWRDERLDASLELSTKVLEYGLLGLPVILNRTPMHERLLGSDYPLFAATEEDVVDAVLDTVTDPTVRAIAVDRVVRAAAKHTFEQSTERLRRIIRRAFPPAIRSAPARGRLKVVVASHDFKFFTAILRRLQATPDVEVRVDAWPALDRHDVESSMALAAWADLVICEWCGPNAVWYSHNKRPGQRLIVRLHRFELDRRWPKEVEIERVDRIVAVSQSYATLMQQSLGWPSGSIEVISNWVDEASLDRVKLPGAAFHLGFIGMAPARKRLDRALDVLEWLRSGDPRYRLFVKSKLSWDYSWLWLRPEERVHADLLMRRLQTSPLLRGSVVFDQFGPDVASWLRGIGFILSTSDDESFHLAPAEGMASGSVPAILDWPGADSIYDSRWIHTSTESMAAYISATVAGHRWDSERDIAKVQAHDDFGLARIGSAWADLIRRVAGDSSPVPTGPGR